jgi:hypothetical protein
MTSYYKDDPKKDYEPEIVIDNAIPANDAPVPNGPPVLPGHHRFYCEKCRTVSAPKCGDCGKLRVSLFFLMCLFRCSPMICHKMPHRGGALDARPSTRLRRQNVLVASSCNDGKVNALEGTESFFVAECLVWTPTEKSHHRPCGSWDFNLVSSFLLLALSQYDVLYNHTPFRVLGII